MTVPYVFSPLPNGSTIPLSQLDADFAYLDGLVQDLDIRLPVRVLENIAALRLLTVTPDYNVAVNGYYANGDGGGGYFYPVYGALPGTYVDNGGTIIVPTGGDGSSAWIRQTNGTLSPKFFGAIGDGIADDIIPLTNTFAASVPYSTIDLSGYTYAITSPIRRPAVGVTVKNGKIYLNNPTPNFFMAFVASDYCIFDGISIIGSGVTGSGVTPKYQGGIIGGNTGWPAPMNVTPANYVTIRNCYFSELTLCIFAGGSSLDPVPTGWRIEGNAFVDIVGYQNLSEGYGSSLSPANNSIIKGNTYKNIHRHAIYLAAQSSNNIVDSNVINGCDNIAIQSNTFAAQDYADGNIITNNNITGLTRSIPYGYFSSVGIGLYGKFKNYLVANNRIYGALDTGIISSSELSNVAYGSWITIENNKIVMDSTSTDCGIRFDGNLSGSVKGNEIVLKSSIQGIAVSAAASATTSADVIDVSENTINTSNSNSLAFRIYLTTDRVVRIFRNTLNGFGSVYTSNIIYDTSSAGTRRTDLNATTGYYDGDSDFTFVANGTTAYTDCNSIRYAGTLTAARTITLTNPTNEIGAQVTIMRTAGGAFNLNIYGSGFIKGLATNTWGTFVWNQGGSWELAAYGSL